jgi:hypothetical protein
LQSAGQWEAHKYNKSSGPSVDQKFSIDEENKYFFWDEKVKKKHSEPENGIRDQIPVLGSDEFFLLHIKFLIDEYITRTF